MYMMGERWCPIFMNCISCLFKEEKVWHFRYRSSFNWLSLHFQVQKKASDDAKAAEGLYIGFNTEEMKADRQGLF